MSPWFSAHQVPSTGLFRRFPDRILLQVCPRFAVRIEAKCSGPSEEQTANRRRDSIGREPGGRARAAAVAIGQCAGDRSLRESRMVYLGRMLPAVILALSLISSSHAQVTVDISRITCEQFVLYQVANADRIAIWLQGYYSAKRSTTTVDTQAFKQNIDRIKQYCRMNFKQTVMQAVDTVFGDAK
jgi:acid stress chaperone HdeB